jgi:hypothetical protein
MPDVIKYVNAKGEAVNFSSPPFFANSKQLRQFTAELKDGIINPNPKGNINLLAVMLISNAEKNRIFNTLDYDAITNQMGRLYVNEWYLPCFFKGVTGIVYEDANTFKGTLVFEAPEMEFLKETKRTITFETAGGKGINYPFNIPYNFSANKRSASKIENKEVAYADFIFEFTGETESVEFAIDDTRYVVDARISSGDRFTLNTLDKTIIKTNNGQEINLFGFAKDDTYIFTPIPSGEHVVTWEGEYAVDFTLIEHRRFPEWT